MAKSTTKSKRTAAKPKNKSKSTRSNVTAARFSVFSKLRNGGKSPRPVMERLRRLNLAASGLHLIQGIAVLVLSKGGLFPVTSSFLSLDEFASNAAGSPVLAVANRELFEVNLAYLVAAFFFMSALAHLVVATVYKRRYETDLNQGINRVRWIEYGFSASTMMVGIALLSGVYEITSLIMIFALIAVMNLMGLLMELYNKKQGQVSWSAFLVGCLAGIVPWLVIGTYLLHAYLYGTGNIPSFVYFIYGSIFLAFNAFAVNMYLQYKKKGKWADYLYGEKVYILLSFVAKSALAWQVFAGTLRP